MKNIFLGALFVLVAMPALATTYRWGDACYEDVTSSGRPYNPTDCLIGANGNLWCYAACTPDAINVTPGESIPGYIINGDRFEYGGKCYVLSPNQWDYDTSRCLQGNDTRIYCEAHMAACH